VALAAADTRSIAVSWNAAMAAPAAIIICRRFIETSVPIHPQYIEGGAPATMKIGAFDGGETRIPKAAAVFLRRYAGESEGIIVETTSPCLS
jgi:hypothetical protein